SRHVERTRKGAKTLNTNRIDAATPHSSDVAARVTLLIKSQHVFSASFHSTVHFREVQMFRMPATFPNVVSRRS
ncbi:hypothetical protein, partial [Burkholderia sp. KCJ3K979]|uniref:hypothetical protein n=1 Tax=Burkholderia sp. KCJ3K979 TaxID=2759149 RepID=UPI001F18DF28